MHLIYVHDYLFRTWYPQYKIYIVVRKTIFKNISHWFIFCFGVFCGFLIFFWLPKFVFWRFRFCRFCIFRLALPVAEKNVKSAKTESPKNKFREPEKNKKSQKTPKQKINQGISSHFWILFSGQRCQVRFIQLMHIFLLIFEYAQCNGRGRITRLGPDGHWNGTTYFVWLIS